MLVAAAGRSAPAGRFRAARGEPAEPAAPAPQQRVGTRGVILCYHRIAALRPDTHSLCVPPDLFAAQMELIARHYRPLPLADLAAQSAAGELTDGAVAVTFDDGYLDNMEVASPILTQFGIPATFFVSGAAGEKAIEGWWDTMERIFISDEEIPERLTIEIGDTHVALETSTARQRRAALLSLHGYLIDAEPQQIAELAKVVSSWSGIELPVRGTHRLMTAPEIADLGARSGHSIGAHGFDHLRLPAHTPEIQAAELGESKRSLEHLLGEPVTTLAYAYGSCNLETTEIAAQAGFDAACTVEGEAVTSNSDPFRLPRVEVHAGSLESFELQLQRLVADAA